MLTSILIATLVGVAMAAPQEASPRTGAWRAWLDCPGGDIPFGLELSKQESSGELQGWLHNGAERVAIGGVYKEGLDLVLRLEPYDATIRARLSKDGQQLKGEWIRYRRPGVVNRVPFHATHGSAPRFASKTEQSRPSGELAERYRVQFSEDKHHSVGLLAKAPNSNKITGTFMTTLGDYRYLEGVLDGSQLSLSCFDGAHAFLFKATLLADGSLKGDFWSKNTWHETWTATPDPEVTLPDPFGLTRFVGGVPFDKLSFPDLDGKMRSLADPQFQGKARLIVLFGTWCPNCNDETDYLVELDRTFRAKGLSILGLAFEFGDDLERNTRVVREYAEFHKAKFPMLIAGEADKEEASKAFPVIDKVLSYPTTLFMNADGEVRAVYAGFSGPATGRANQRLREAFEMQISTLLKEAK